jgi:hypothetical protein
MPVYTYTSQLKVSPPKRKLKSLSLVNGCSRVVELNMIHKQQILYSRQNLRIYLITGIFLATCFRCVCVCTTPTIPVRSQLLYSGLLFIISYVPPQFFQFDLIYQVVSPKYWLILSDLHGVISQNAGIYISIGVATPNLGYNRYLQDCNYTDRLLCSKWSQLNAEPAAERCKK